MVSRYDRREVFLNTEEKYDKLFKKRNTKSIRQFNTANLTHPTVDQITNLNVINHIWIEGDRFWKLAAKYYDKADLWWVIAWFNRMPTEGQVEIGDIVAVPLPIEKILDYLDV
jgi:hypothetical protein